jgi:hypothetical protein
MAYGMRYCAEHFLLVQRLREWLCWQPRRAGISKETRSGNAPAV